MKSKNLREEFVKRIENKQPLKIDLKNGVILDLKWDDKIQNYRGYWKEEDIGVGIWTIETLIQIATGIINNVALVEN